VKALNYSPRASLTKGIAVAVTSSLENQSLAPASATPVPAPESPTPEPAETPEKPADDGTYGRGPDIPAKQFLVDQIDETNLAEDYAPDVLDKLGQLVVFEFNIDENSRSDWKDKAEKAMKFALQEAEEKVYPWPKSSNIIYPLITQAAVEFNARTYPAIIQNRNVVKGIVWGTDKGTPATEDGKPDGKPKLHPDGSPVWLSAPGDKRKRADRIGEHMSWQLLEEMKEWETQTDSMLLQIPVVGGAVRKTYRDPIENRNRSLLVSLMHIVWNYHAPSFDDAPRHTEIITLYPHQIEEYERAEVFLPQIYGPGGDGETIDGHATGESGDEDAPQVFLEQHRRYDLDEDGYPEPYIVTVHKRSSKVVRIVARYDEEGIQTGKGADVDEDSVTGGITAGPTTTEGADVPSSNADDGTEDIEEITKIVPVEHYTLIPFLPNPDGGSYPIGFGHLLRPLNEAINTTLNQMFDAGHLQNAGGGFVSDQLSIHSGPVNFQVGKYVRVGSKGQAIRDAVLPLPFPGPSQGLFQLLGLLLTCGKEVASVQNVLTGDAALANAPPTTILALIEQGLKVYTAIHKRVYRALKSEFAKIYRLNRLYLTESQRYRIGDEWREVTPEDYRLGGGVEPIADPTMTTDMQKLGRAQILMGFKDDPMINQKEIRTRLFDAASIDRIEDIFAPPPDPQKQQMIEQLLLEEKQAELGRLRAAELKDNSQAYLNMAKAAEATTGPQMDWIDKQLRIMELHIEATNTMVRAADVEVKRHGHNVRGALGVESENTKQTVAGMGDAIASQSPPTSQLPPTGIGQPPAGMPGFPPMPGGAPGAPGGGPGSSLPRMMPPMPPAGDQGDGGTAGLEGPPPGQGSGAPGFDPTSIGARLAPDGQHYLPDPRRPGKYLRVAA
jgi:chaperonin GroES